IVTWMRWLPSNTGTGPSSGVLPTTRLSMRTSQPLGPLTVTVPFPTVSARRYAPGLTWTLRTILMPCDGSARVTRCGPGVTSTFEGVRPTALPSMETVSGGVVTTSSVGFVRGGGDGSIWRARGLSTTLALSSGPELALVEPPPPPCGAAADGPSAGAGTGRSGPDRLPIQNATAAATATPRIPTPHPHS